MLERRVFVDTGAFIALFHTRDQHNKAALPVWKQIDEEGVQCITTCHVVDELATLLARRTSYEFSASKIEAVFKDDYEILIPTAEQNKKALNLFKKYADQKVSFTDCLSFVAMDDENLKQAFTFDRTHFTAAQLEVVP